MEINFIENMFTTPLDNNSEPLKTIK